MFLLTIFLWSRGPIVAFKPWFNWFDKWDSDKQYRCISPTLMAYFYGPVFMFDIAKMISRQDTARYDWYIDFIMMVMRTYGYGIIKGNAGAVLVPRNICESLAPDKTDPKEALLARDAMNFHKGISTIVNGETYTLSADCLKTWPKTPEDWYVIMCAPKEVGGWGCNFKDETWQGDTDAWKTKTNFLWNFYAIPQDSALIKGFIVKQPTWGGLRLMPDAILPLLGITEGQTYGGWYGFLQRGDMWGNYNSASVQNFVWSSALTPSHPATAPCGSPAEYIGSGLSMGLSVIPFLFPEEGAEMTAGAVAKIAAGGLMGAGVGGLLGAISQGCLGGQ